MDYGKFKYEADQRAKESRKKSSNLTVKEMKYRPKIGPGDFDTKTRKVEKFLGRRKKVGPSAALKIQSAWRRAIVRRHIRRRVVRI